MGGEPRQADGTAQALHRLKVLAWRARRQGHPFTQLKQRARQAVGKRRAVDRAGDADDRGHPVGQCGILRQRLQFVDRAFGMSYQDQGFSRRQRHDRVADDIRIGVATASSPRLNVVGGVALRLEVRGGVREHPRQIGYAFGEHPGHHHHPRARRDMADGHRPASRRRRWTTASDEQQRNRGEHDAPAKPSLTCLLRCRIGSDFDAARAGIRR